MQKIYPELRRLGGEVLAVSFTPPARVKAFLDEQPQPFPMVSDPTLAGYRAFGLQRTTVRAMLGLGVISRYLRLMFRGWWPGKRVKGEDVLQLGGDFILDRDGGVRYAHPSIEPTDRPSSAELLRQVREIAATKK